MSKKVDWELIGMVVAGLCLAAAGGAFVGGTVYIALHFIIKIW